MPWIQPKIHHHHISPRHFVVRGLLLGMLLAIFTTASMAQAETWGQKHPLLAFSAGILSSYAIHEAAHTVTAAVTDTDLTWEVGTYNQPLGFTEDAESDSAGAWVHASGLIAQVATSEVILQVDSIDKNANYVRGMMAWNVLNPVIYAVDYFIIGQSNNIDDTGYQGDIAGVEHYTDKATADLFAMSMAGIAIFQGIRFLNTQDWMEASHKYQAWHFDIAPVKHGGLQLSFSLDF